MLRWGDAEAARTLATAPPELEPEPEPEGAAAGGELCKEGGGRGDENAGFGSGFDLVVGTDLLYFAGAEVTQRLALTIANLLRRPAATSNPPAGGAGAATAAGSDDSVLAAVVPMVMAVVAPMVVEAAAETMRQLGQLATISCFSWPRAPSSSS